MSFNIEFQHMPLDTIMSAEEALAIYNLLEDNGIKIWLDGGWAVDAHLGMQTRRHNDIDIAIEASDVVRFCQILTEQGYKHAPRHDDKPENFVLSDGKSHQIDVHIFVWDEQGNGVYGPAENNVMWPSSSLESWGNINGQPVRATSPECLVQFHTGYEVDADDWHDVRLLCKKFALEIPVDYEKFQEQTKRD